MKKTEFRENIFKMLFAALYHTDEESAEQAALYIDTLGNISEKNKENLVKKYEGVLAHREEIDGWINEKAEGWTPREWLELICVPLDLEFMRWFLMKTWQ